MTALALLLGAGAGLGLVLVVAGLRGVPPRPGVPLARARLERPLLRLAPAAGAGLLVGLGTGWPVGGLLAAALGTLAPDLLGSAHRRRAEIGRIEAVAAWAEMLRDTLAGAAGLEQAIAATAPAAPTPIRVEVGRLAARLERQRLAPALRAFAAEVADPTMDLVAAALILASRRHARQLGDLLGALAATAREHAAMRLRVEAGRARVRAAVRVITGTTLAVAAALVVLNRGYLEPYDTAAGQLVLAAVGGLFAAAFWWLGRLAQPAPPERLLGLPQEEVAGG